MSTTQTKQTKNFEAEVKQVLDLVIHSLYSNNEIFLRELISNSSDALDKLRFKALTESNLLAENEELNIKIAADEEAKEIYIRDNGIGMDDADLASNLGTIAKSGTKEFLNALKASKAENVTIADSLIGQFGVGFYSAFIVAKEVQVLTRKAGSEQLWLWQSTGEGTYDLEALSEEAAKEYLTEDEPMLKQGTKIIIKLKEGEDHEKYLADYQIRNIVKKYSDFIEYPIKLKVTNPEVHELSYAPEDEIEEAKAEREEKLANTEKFVFEVVNSQKAIWTKDKSEVTKEEYNDFYKHISHDFTDPLTHIHYAAEGTNEFKALLYVPAKAPFDLYLQEESKSIQLYINKVFITSESELLLPKYLRFIKGVVDATDLPLNVSREMLQDNPKVRAIKKNITKKVLTTLSKMKDKDRDEYLKFFNEFGRVVKEGVHSDFANKDKLMDLMFFESSKQEAGKLVDLETYSKDIDLQTELNEETRKCIYYITGENRAELENSPYLEALKAKNIEVLFLVDPIDEWVVMSVPEYKGKKLKPIHKGDIDLGDKEEKQKEKEAKTEELKDLLGKMKDVLDNNVKEVRFSDRLVDTLACLVVEEGEMSAHMERIYKNANQDIGNTKRILELNASHPVVNKMKDLYEANSHDPAISDYAELIFDQALLLEGSKIKDLNRFTKLMGELMAK